MEQLGGASPEINPVVALKGKDAVMENISVRLLVFAGKIVFMQ